MILAILACKIREASNIIYVSNCIMLCSALLCHALRRNWADTEREREREREMCVCARWTETEQTDGESARERESGVCACWESKTSSSCGSTGDSLRLNKVWVLYFRGKKSLKVSAMLLSWQHCASAFLQLRVVPWIKQKIHAALIAR